MTAPQLYMCTVFGHFAHCMVAVCCHFICTVLTSATDFSFVYSPRYEIGSYCTQLDLSLAYIAWLRKTSCSCSRTSSLSATRLPQTKLCTNVPVTAIYIVVSRSQTLTRKESGSARLLLYMLSSPDLCPTFTAFHHPYASTRGRKTTLAHIIVSPPPAGSSAPPNYYIYYACAK